jgi:hypothetical protein
MAQIDATGEMTVMDSQEAELDARHAAAREAARM